MIKVQNIQTLKMSKRLIIYKLANKYNLPLQKIEEIINFQFKYVTEVMKEGNFDSVRLPYFGKFSANKHRIKYITDLKNKKDGKN